MACILMLLICEVILNEEAQAQNDGRHRNEIPPSFGDAKSFSLVIGTNQLDRDIEVGSHELLFSHQKLNKKDDSSIDK